MTPEEAEFVAAYVKTAVSDALKRRLATHDDVAEIAYASSLEAIRMSGTRLYRDAAAQTTEQID